MANHSTITGALDEISDHFEGHVQRIIDALENLMQELAAKGEGRMIEILESAVTPTGAARAALGGIAGRVETGKMRDAISSDVENDGDTIIAEWGWLDEVAAYFLIQERGDEVFGVQFEGMKALLGSYIEMREELRGRLGDMK